MNGILVASGTNSEPCPIPFNLVNNVLRHRGHKLAKCSELKVSLYNVLQHQIFAL